MGTYRHRNRGIARILLLLVLFLLGACRGAGTPNEDSAGLKITQSGWYALKPGKGQKSCSVQFWAKVKNTSSTDTARFVQVKVRTGKKLRIGSDTATSMTADIPPGASAWLAGSLYSRSGVPSDVSFALNTSTISLTEDTEDTTLSRAFDFTVKNLFHQKLPYADRLTGEVTFHGHVPLRSAELIALYRKDDRVVYVTGATVYSLPCGQAVPFRILASERKMPDWDDYEVVVQGASEDPDYSEEKETASSAESVTSEASARESSAEEIPEAKTPAAETAAETASAQATGAVSSPSSRVQLTLSDTGYYLENPDPYSENQRIVFWGRVHNNSKEYTAPIVHLEGTARGRENRVLDTEPAYGPEIAPGSSAWMVGQLDCGNQTPHGVTFRSYCLYTDQDPDAHTAGPKEFTISDISQKKDDYSNQVTGTVTYTGKKELESARVIVFLKKDGKIVYAEDTPVDVRKSSSSTFEVVLYPDRIPRYDQLEVIAQGS